MGWMGKFAKSESPGHGVVESVHLYNLIYRFEDVEGGLKGSAATIPGVFL